MKVTPTYTVALATLDTGLGVIVDVIFARVLSLDFCASVLLFPGLLQVDQLAPSYLSVDSHKHLAAAFCNSAPGPWTRRSLGREDGSFDVL